MKDRRALQEELNRINELYQQKDLELRKSGGSDVQRQQMRDMLNAKKERLMAEMGDDLQNLNRGGSAVVSGGTISKLDIDQSKLPDIAKQSNLGKGNIFKSLGRKVAGIVPLAGVGVAALSGDPAMAAEEAAGDIPVVGQAYEALKSEDAGNREEEQQMLAERDAMESYKNSPARADALKKIRGY